MDRRTFLRTGVVGAGGALVLPAAAAAPATAAPRVAQVLARGLAVPWGVAFLPSGHALVGERDTGAVHRVNRSGGRRRVGEIPVHKPGPGEGGLLGLALSPTFARDRWVYALISTASDNRVVRMRFVDGSLGRPRLVLGGIPTNTSHNGGRLVFHEGLLYASTGDAEDPDLAQDRRSLAGKILRLTPDGSVPRGNPFGNHVWSYGHRNVEGLAFDARGTLWASEFGSSRWDELNRIVRGGNYGWPRVEGRDGAGGFRDPLAVWRPADCSPSGVAVARGRAFLGALRGQSLWAVRLRGPHAGRKVRYFHTDFGRIRTVQKAPDGSLWITTSNRDGRIDPVPADDRVLRIVLG